jgi:hypothetical protein
MSITVPLGENMVGKLGKVRGMGKVALPWGGLRHSVLKYENLESVQTTVFNQAEIIRC